MNKYLFIKQFAQAYGCGTYNSDSYDEASCGTGTDPTPENPPLADTGYDILLPIIVAVSILVAGIILVIKRLHRAHRAKKAK